MKIASGVLATGLALTATVAAASVAAPAHAEELGVFAGTATFEATTADGGAMTASSRSVSPGGGDPHHDDQYLVDHYASVGSQIEVERLATYEVTVTFEDAVAEESAEGTGAEARGYGEVALYDCCFAGEQSFIQDATTELPTAAGDAVVRMEFTPYDDMTLNIQSELHALATTSTAHVGSAEVAASSAAVTVDVTLVEPAPEQPEEDPDTQPSLLPGTPLEGVCVLGLCL